MGSKDIAFLEDEPGRERARQVRQKVVSAVDRLLQTGNMQELPRWKSYLESGEGKEALSHSGELNRLLRILTILQIERMCKDPGESFFADGVDCYQALLDRYLTTVFAVRRVLFRLSEESCREGMAFLERIAVSPYAVYAILAYEIRSERAADYRALADALAEVWTSGEQRIFLELSSRRMEG